MISHVLRRNNQDLASFSRLQENTTDFKIKKLFVTLILLGLVLRFHKILFSKTELTSYQANKEPSSRRLNHRILDNFCKKLINEDPCFTSTELTCPFENKVLHIKAIPSEHAFECLVKIEDSQDIPDEFMGKHTACTTDLTKEEKKFLKTSFNLGEENHPIIETENGQALTSVCIDTLIIPSSLGENRPATSFRH